MPSSFAEECQGVVSTDDLPVTEWLRAAAAGDQASQDRIAEWAYAELAELAEARMRRSGDGLTLEPAGLVNETFLKLLEHPTGFANRRHFFAFASQVMLRVLIDYQRSRNAVKRGGGAVKVTLEGLALEDKRTSADAVLVRDVLQRLEAADARKAEVARLRALWGLEVEEIADMLEVSVPTVVRDWRFVRNWLADRLDR